MGTVRNPRDGEINFCCGTIQSKHLLLAFVVDRKILDKYEMIQEPKVRK